uniref:Uncharacterized protein n=1 Tax=Lactuca sativa TaxID=4236 RepID=A0A9R1UF56_LACSA|nr:hypothetical protein LSAT_V11C900474670 [Lactuca sativa]
MEIILSYLPSDPGTRTMILDYDPNVPDKVRRAYLLEGPFQPKCGKFPYILFGKNHEDSMLHGGDETFVGVGLKNYGHKEKLNHHVGGFNSVHSQAWAKCRNLLNDKQHVDVAFAKHSTQIDYNQIIEVVTFNNAPLNMKLTSPHIQKVIVCYVDREGRVIECFLSIKHISYTITITLKETLDNLFSRHGLSISNFNMKGKLGGLTTLIINESVSEYYVHFFCLAASTYFCRRGEIDTKIVSLFVLLTNVVGGSCKCLDRLREQQASKFIEAIILGEIISGRGLNQETYLIKPRDTH